jgi:methionyl aminopeptidase
VRTAEEIEAMRVAGRVAAEALIEVGRHVAPGVTTDELDRIGHEAMVAAGAYPSTLNYRGYPKSLCTSVNEVICHGIPDSRRLRDGDIVNVDVTAYIEGVHGDTSCTFLVGDVDERSAQLVEATRAAMHAGISVVRPGARIYEIGRAIESEVTPAGYSVVREFIGHGIGDQFHTSLQIPHYYDPRNDTVITEGMTFTVEPMVNLGTHRLEMWDDGWTVVTRDLQRSAQFEHTVLVTADGFELLTVPGDGEPAEVRFAGQRLHAATAS